MYACEVQCVFDLLVASPEIEVCGVLCLKSQLSVQSNIGIWSQDLWTAVILRRGSE